MTHRKGAAVVKENPRLRRASVVLLAPRRISAEAEDVVVEVVNFCLRRRDGEGTRR